MIYYVYPILIVHGMVESLSYKNICICNSASLSPGLRSGFATQLVEITAREPHLTSYSYDSLKDGLDKGQFFIANYGETLVGSIRIHPILLRGICLGYEVATFYVSEDYRGAYIFPFVSEMLFAHVLENADSRRIPLIFETTNPNAANFCMRSLGFRCLCINNRIYPTAIFNHYLPRIGAFFGWLYNNVIKYRDGKEEYLGGISDSEDYYAFIRFPSVSLMKQLVLSPTRP